MGGSPSVPPSAPPSATTPPGRSECYTQQRNAVVDVPLNQLNQGNNQFQGLADRQVGRAAAFGRQGLAYVEREYRWDRVMRKVETVVETLAPPSELDRDSR